MGMRGQVLSHSCASVIWALLVMQFRPLQSTWVLQVKTRNGGSGYAHSPSVAWLKPRGSTHTCHKERAKSTLRWSKGCAGLLYLGLPPNSFITSPDALFLFCLVYPSRQPRIQTQRLAPTFNLPDIVSRIVAGQIGREIIPGTLQGSSLAIVGRRLFTAL